jgi:hypothetical protein
MRTPVRDLGHEGPFEACQKTAAPTPAQSRSFHLIGDPVASGIDELFGSDPGAALTGCLEAPIVVAVEIGKDAVLVGKHGFPSTL